MSTNVWILIGAAAGLAVGWVIVAIRRARAQDPQRRPGWAPAAVGAVAGGVLGAFLGAGASGASEHLPTVSTAAEFDRQVLQAEQPVLVDFYATWCPPCRVLAPRIADLAEEYEGRATFVGVDVDVKESPEIAARYGVRNIPTVIVFRDGRVAGRLVGIEAADTYREVLNRALTAEASAGPAPSGDAEGLQPAARPSIGG